jgi:predicted AlkP superfamily pyrophosphatase or phosphodiesterase
VTPRPLILVVIDGLCAAAFESATDAGAAPNLAALAEHGTYRRGTSAFPSLTPVCLSSIATGALPDVHEIPHLVWYSRREHRLVEYGSSFSAVRANGIARTLRDTLVNMNERHLGQGATTLFESLADAGLETAAINFTAYRGRTRHRASVPFLGSVDGPESLFFYNLFESGRTGAPHSWRSRRAGSVDAYATGAARWLVTRGAFDFLLFYLSDYDYASHERGPDDVSDVLARCDASVGAVVDAAGGLDALLERYAVVVMSDHGQTAVEHVARLERRYDDVPGALVAASNRAAQVYRLAGGCPAPRSLALRLDTEPSAGVVLFLEDGRAVARRDQEELRFAPDGDGGWALSGDLAILDHPDALRRSYAALVNPNAGDVLVSAAPSWEFADLGGGDHLGGGSHGSLDAGDSDVPLLTVGLEGEPSSIVDVAPLVRSHFGVTSPPVVLAGVA